MKKFENVVIKDEETQESVYIDPRTKKEVACTINLMMMVLNNPQTGQRNDGSPVLGYSTLEDFQKASSVYDRLKQASKSSPAGAESVKSFELEDSDVEIVQKYVRQYRPLYTSMVWKPFIDQVFGEKK